MKKIVCLILVLLTACGLFGGFAAAETGDADLFAQNLSEACYVQEGHFEYMDTIALASRGKLISCFGNNAGSGYLVPMIPPAPNQEAAPATEMGQFSWPAEEPTALNDPAAENQPCLRANASMLRTVTGRGAPRKPAQRRSQSPGT